MQRDIGGMLDLVVTKRQNVLIADIPTEGWARAGTGRSGTERHPTTKNPIVIERTNETVFRMKILLAGYFEDSLKASRTSRPSSARTRTRVESSSPCGQVACAKPIPCRT